VTRADDQQWATFRKVVEELLNAGVKADDLHGYIRLLVDHRRRIAAAGRA
jgi:hypothetical protein